MAPSPRRDPAQLNLRIVGAAGSYGAVWLSDEAWDEYEKLKSRNDETSIRQSMTMRTRIARFVELGPKGLNDSKMFKSLGQHKIAGTSSYEQIFEIKAYQWRLYGVLRNVEGRPAFIGLCVDPSKKKDKADQALLKRCADMSGGLKDQVGNSDERSTHPQKNRSRRMRGS